MKKNNIFALGLCFLSANLLADHWPRYQGETGRGICNESGLALTWDDSNLLWKVEIKDVGQSSPIIWGDDVFLTSANERGDERYVHSINKNTGVLNWKATYATDRKESMHSLNSMATASCVSDGHYVVAFFGASGLHCLDVKGNKIWSKDLGTFPGVFGTAASPIILGDRVIQNCDAIGESYLLALELKTGKEVWKTPRMEKPKGGWATPILIETSQRKELVLNGEFGVQSYAPETGEKLWFCKSFNGRGTPTPAFKDDILFVLNGKTPGDMYAVKANGFGDVTDTHMIWHTPRGRGRDIPSPMIVGDSIFVVNMKGDATCYDVKSGAVVWTQELPKDDYIASAIVVDEHLLLISESGVTSVIAIAPSYKLVASNRLTTLDKEKFRASIAVSDKKLYIRSDKFLYCVKP